MTKQTVAAVFFSILTGLGTGVTAKASDIVQTLPTSYDSPDGYDYVNAPFPPTTPVTIGTFTFTIPTGMYVTGIAISGSFGNPDSDTTALSDYYLGFSGSEAAVDVANCDSNVADCSADDGGPTAWTDVLTQPQIAALTTGLSGGSLDFTYTWDTIPAFALSGVDQYIYAGPASIDITVAATPEPATLLFCFSGLAGMVAVKAVRRFRKV